MRVLLDESLPRPLAKLLTGHTVRTVTQMTWTSLPNGELFRRAADDFDVVLTADQNVESEAPSIVPRTTARLGARHEAISACSVCRSTSVFVQIENTFAP